MSPARAGTHTALNGVKRTNHQATADIAFYFLISPLKMSAIFFRRIDIDLQTYCCRRIDVEV